MEKIFFVHFRIFNEDTGDFSSKGGTTVAYTEETPGNFKYAAAFCHEKDPYVKAYGRAKAAGRLKSAAHAQTVRCQDKDEFMEILARLYDYDPVY